VDATYRADLLQINELNFSRFDARLEQQLAQFRAVVEQRFEQLDLKWNGRWTEVDGRIESGLAQLDVKIDQRRAELRAELIKWMFVFWAGTLVPLGGLILFLVR
jgi:hypothetical protein